MFACRADDLQVIFATVDPERDPPERLRECMKAFHPAYLALTGRADQIARTANEFRAFCKKVPTGSSSTMDHTGLSDLFDRQGHVRVALRHEQGVGDGAADIRAQLDQPES